MLSLVFDCLFRGFSCLGLNSGTIFVNCRVEGTQKVGLFICIVWVYLWLFVSYWAGLTPETGLTECHRDIFLRTFKLNSHISRFLRLRENISPSFNTELFFFIKCACRTTENENCGNFLYFSLADNTEKKEKGIFEGDIELTESDREGVDTRNTNSGDTADVDIDSVITKRKAISSRRNLWVEKVVPLELGLASMSINAYAYKINMFILVSIFTYLICYM